jgi:hypothetical protein
LDRVGFDRSDNVKNGVEGCTKPWRYHQHLPSAFPPLSRPGSALVDPDRARKVHRDARAQRRIIGIWFYAMIRA